MGLEYLFMELASSDNCSIMENIGIKLADWVYLWVQIGI